MLHIQLAPAADYSFAVQNQQPLSMIFGLPRLHSAEIVAQDESRWDWSFDISNSFTGSATADEFIFLDGENGRLGLRYRKGFADNWEWGVEIPLVYHTGGIIDGLVIEFHDLFGFDQQGRDGVARDQLDYRYIRNGQSLLDFNDAGMGLGDINLLLGRQLYRSDSASTAVRAHIKLPTGDSAQLFGSGGVDAHLGINHTQMLSTRWQWSVGGGITYLGDGDVLPAQQRNHVFNAHTGLNWQVFEKLGLRVQWDMHTPLYENSDLGQLDDAAFLLSMGGRVALGRLGVLDLAIIENAPNPKASPDVGFYINWRPAGN